MKKTADSEAEFIRSLDRKHVMVGLVDFDGIVRGKYIHKDKFLSVLKSGSAYCSVIFGWNSNDSLFENGYTGWFNGFPDAPVRVVPESRRILPDGDIPFYLLEFMDDGAKYCPRNLAGRVLKRAAEAGFSVKSGFEYECFAFNETPVSAMEKGYRNLKPMTPTTGGYSILRTSVHSEFFEGLLDLSEALETPIEGFHPEAGEGAVEYAHRPSDGIEAADRAAIFKLFSKVWSQRNDISLCYMAKPAKELPGCGGHLHMSLHKDGTPSFFDHEKDQNLSQVVQHFIAGQMKYMPELLCMTAPTVNAFTRLTPGYWAPTAANWGFDNRTCSLRVVGDSPKSLRVEYRVTSADSNPYLVMAAALASGMAGVEEKLELAEPTLANAYAEKSPDKLNFPRTLHDAAGRLRASKMAKDWFGPEFVEQFAASREFEEAEYQAHVSDWELRRYFEMI